MTPEALGYALLAGICGLTLVLAVYELATGRIPGKPVERGVWGYRWITTPRASASSA